MRSRTPVSLLSMGWKSLGGELLTVAVPLVVLAGTEGSPQSPSLSAAVEYAEREEGGRAGGKVSHPRDSHSHETPGGIRNSLCELLKGGGGGGGIIGVDVKTGNTSPWPEKEEFTIVIPGTDRCVESLRE